MKALFFVIVLFVLPTTSWAATIFSETFESLTVGNISSNNDNCADSNCTALKTNGWDFVRGNCLEYCSATIVNAAGLAFTSPRTGKVLRYEYRSDQDTEGVPAQDAHNSNLIKLFTPTLAEIYGRVFFATNVDNTASSATSSQWFQSGTKLHYIKSNNGPSTISGVAYTAVTPPGALVAFYNTGEYAVCPSGGIPVNIGGSGCNNNFQNTNAVYVRDKQWYCFEYHIKLNSSATVSDGMVEYWIDGTLVQQFPNQKIWNNAPYTFDGSKISQIEVYRQHSNHMYRYEDDLVWGSTRIGCGGTSPQPDTVPPSPPTGLQVN
jgi:hypothetical protein